MSILVVLEQQAGQWHRMSWETLAAAQQIGGELNQPVEAAVLGQDVSGLAAELGGKKSSLTARVKGSLFAALGGMHNVHVNSTGEPALKKGGPYPNGTMFVIDLHNFAVVDGSYVEGPVKRLALMEKDTKNTPRLAVGAFNSGREEIPGRQWSPMQPNNASDAISPK